jgi:20S proteasome alpha/beta subunit
VPAGFTPAGGRRHASDGKREEEIMNITDHILGAMAGVASATASVVALYVDEAMLHTSLDDGVTRLLPVIAVEAGGYVRFTPSLADEVAQHFGALLPVAEIRVEEINRAYGLEPDDAFELVELSMQRSGGLGIPVEKHA